MFQKKPAGPRNSVAPPAGGGGFRAKPMPGLDQHLDLEKARSIIRVSGCRATRNYFRSQAANSGLVSRRISSTADRSWAVMVA